MDPRARSPPALRSAPCIAERQQPLCRSIVSLEILLPSQGGVSKVLHASEIIVAVCCGLNLELQ